MKYSIKDVAKWGESWQTSDQWQVHTLAPAPAEKFATRYLAFLQSMCGWQPTAGHSAGLEIGAGAGNVAAAFGRHGIDMVASEWSDAGLALIQRENPGLKTRKLDVMEFHDSCAWDFIFCRELYPFTRVNAFTDQFRVVSCLIDALKPGGTLMLVGSDVLWPHCLDQPLLIKQLRKDPRLASVSDRYLEVVVRRPFLARFGKVAYTLASALLWPVVTYKRSKGWAAIYVIAIRKSADGPAANAAPGG